MPSFHAGQRVQAGALNGLTTLVTGLAGGPTSGGTELELTGSITVPPAPIERWATPSAMVRLSPTAACEFNIAIKFDNASGSTRGSARIVNNTSVRTKSVRGFPTIIPAGQSQTYVVTLLRIAGTGDVTLSGGAAFNLLAVDLVAVT